MKTLKTFQQYNLNESKKDVTDTIVDRAIDHLNFVLDFGFKPSEDELKEKINNILNQIWSSSDAHPEIQQALENERENLVDKIIEKFSDESV